MFQSQDRNARKFFMRVTKLQLKYAFYCIKALSRDFPKINNLLDSQEFANENPSRPEKLVKLPPILGKTVQSQIIGPQNTSFHPIYEKRDEQSIEKVETPGIFKPVVSSEIYKMPNDLMEFMKAYEQQNSSLKHANKKAKGRPLKIGDIVFFKFTPEIAQINIKNSIQGVVTGDGIASNKIECVSCEASMRKNAMNMFRKSLFCIENHKKYLSVKKYQLYKEKKKELLSQKKAQEFAEEDYKKILKFWEQKAKDEKEDNLNEYKKIEGQSIVYGQSIQLKHIYSGCYLTLKSEDLARQNGCVEMTLEESDTDHSNFKFLPINNLRNIGDVVSYSDIINIASCKEENYYLHIASESLLASGKQLIEDAMIMGLEVNGSEIQSNLKVNCYLNHIDNAKNQEISGKLLLNGDIVSIFNRETGTYLTVDQRNVSEYFIDKTVLISSGEDKYGTLAQNAFTIQYLCPENIIESDEKLGIFCEKMGKSFNSLWEIQRKKTFDGSILDITDCFRIKNVATGLFLNLNSKGEPDLTNTPTEDGFCYFNFVSKFMNVGTEKAIKYDETLRIKASNTRNMFLGLEGLKNNTNQRRTGVIFSDKKGDSTKFLFEVKASDLKSRNFVDRISSLVPYLMKFYLFLQGFGMAVEQNKQNNNENVLRYDYENALHQEKDLENEIRQLFESLENLHQFLRVDLNQEDENMFRLRQDILNNQKIIEILIIIARLIDQMCRGNSHFLENRPAEKQVKIKQDRQNSSYKNLDKTPFAIARKHLENPMKEIFSFLYLAIKGNEKSSQFILEYDEFFKSQLKFFFPEIAALLKEAFRCSYMLKSNDVYGNQIIEWIKLLENLNETAKNLENQALYLELIAYALVDANDAPVVRYQEKCLQELFVEKNQPANGKKNRLLKFSTVSDQDDKQRAVISFPKEEGSEFLENNPSLHSLTLVRGDKFDESVASFYLDEFLENNEGNNNILAFINYICANLKLLSYLIKGRHLKSMKKVKTLGLSTEHIILNIYASKSHPKIKANYLHLFQYLYLDKEPFVHLSSYENRCVIWNDLDTFTLKSPTYGLINNIELQIKSYGSDGQNTLKDFEAIKDLINEFWSEQGIIEFKDNENSDDSKRLHSQIELFMSFLKITRVIVDLGYSNKEMNDCILYGVGHIFAPIMEERINEEIFISKDQVYEKNGLNQNHWIMMFMKKLIEGKIDISQEIEAILHQTTKIFMIFTKIRINLQIISFLKLFKKNQKDPKKLEENSDFEFLFHIYDFNIEKVVHNRQSSPTNRRDIDAIYDYFMKKNIQILQDKSYEGLHLDSIFLYSLFSSNYMSVRLRKNLLIILVDYFNQRTFLLSELIETEIIDTDEELKIYLELDGINMINNKVISIKRLNQLIEKLLHYHELLEFTQGKSNSQKVNSYIKGKLEKTMEITFIIDIINEKFRERKHNPYLFLKTQNILRNLQYHEVFMKVLGKIHPSCVEEKVLIEKILHFFCYFTYLNGINQQQILAKSSIFYNLMNENFAINKLFAFSLEITKNSNTAFENINIFFDMIEDLEPFKQESRTFVTIQIVSIIKSLVTNQEKTSLPRIQKKILARLLKNKKLLKFTMKKSYLEYKSNLLKKLTSNPESLDKILLHLSVVQLFGNLCRDFKMGTLQMQKVLVYEQMKNLLFDTNTPFFYKKPYLKALYEIYVVRIQEVNMNFSPSDMAELLNQLVLADLNVYTKYLEGIVKIDERDPETAVRNKDLREKIAENRYYYQSALDNQNEEKPNISTGLSYKKQNNLLAGSGAGMIFDTKKFINDPSEYWDYLFGGKTWDNSRDGLFYFLLDCFYEAKKRDWLVLFEANDSLTDALSLIKSCLVRMKVTLQKLEKDFSIDLSNYYLMIMEGVTVLPTKVVTKAGKALKIQNDTKGNYKMEKVNVREEFEAKLVEDDQNNLNIKDAADNLLDRIRTILIKKRMKINDFLNLFQMKLEIVPRKKFVDNFLDILREDPKINKSDIESLIEKWSISKNGPHYVNYRKFCEKMRRFYIKKKFNYEEEDMLRRDKKEINLEETEKSFEKDSQLNHFIMNYYNRSLKEYRNNEIKDLAIKFKENLYSMYQNIEDEEILVKGFVESLKKLILVFSTDFSSIYLIKILRIFLEQSKPKAIEEEEQENDDYDEEKILKEQAQQKKEFKRLQNCFEKAGVCSYSLTFIKSKSPLLYVHEAICLLINCLEFGNNYIQESILNVLKRDITDITSPFFHFIKAFLMNQGRDTDFDKIISKPTKFKIDQFSQEELIQLNDDKFVNKDKVLAGVVRFLSLCCENCNSPFQNFLREQLFDEIKQNFVSNNIVLETSNMLTFLSTSTKAEIVAETLTTLTEYSLGPCNENQSILCNNKRLITYINENILKLPLNFMSLEDIENDKIMVFSKSIEFLLSLVIGHKNVENLGKLLVTLEISELFNKMNQIFKKRIRKFVKQILQEDHKYLTEETLNIIKTGFNIFILLTILKESFPNHPSLNYLNLNLPFSLKKYKEQKIKFLQRKKALNPKKSSKKIMPAFSPRRKKGSQVGTYIEFEKTAKSANLQMPKEDDINSVGNGVNEETEFLKKNSEGFIDNEVQKNAIGEYDKEILKREFKDFFEMKAIKNMKESLIFYKGLVGSVEIQRDEELSKIYFQKPFVSDFKTPNIKYHLIYNANRESDQARIEHLFFNVDNFYQEMKHRQRIYRYRILNFFIEFWRSLKDISFVLIIIINILLLISYGHTVTETSADLQNELNNVNNAFTIIQLVICVFVVIFCMVERYPVSIHQQIGNFTAIKKNFLKNQAGLEISNRGYFSQLILKSEIKIEHFFIKLEDSRYKYLKIFLDLENIYNLIYLSTTLVAFFYPLAYSLLLLDLIKRSEDLQNIIRAVTLNWASLLKTLVLGAAVIYMFSVIGYLEFWTYYQAGGPQIAYAETLLRAYTSTLNLGLRSGGGIGDALAGPTIDDPQYWNFWVFTLVFFIVINILFINIIFGIIIDTFGELRDMRKELIKDVEEKCFICGVDSYDFETKGKGWLDHIYLEHNVYHYLDFLIYIKQKNMIDCNGVEKYVKELVEKKNIDFIPIGKALALIDEDDEKKE